MLKSFMKDNGGAVAVLVAMLAIPLLGFVGLSIDVGRAYVLKSKLSTAVDAAGLAVGRNIFSPDAEIYADAQKYFDANFTPGYMATPAITMNASTLTWDTTKETISIKVSVELPTTFMQIFGFETLTVGAETEIKRDNRGMELVLVLDNTTSMDESFGAGNRLSELKSAAKDLIKILYGSDETRAKLWVGIVPYTTQVNIGPQNVAFLKSADRNNVFSNSASIFTKDSNNTALGRDADGNGTYDTVYGWRGCVEMRDDLRGGFIDMTDNPPDNDFVPYFYGSNEDFNRGGFFKNEWEITGVTGSRGPNRHCPPAILPLTAEKTAVDNKIDSLVSDGVTGIQVGAIWGWRVLSPRWNGRWFGSSTLDLPDGYTALPLDYDTEYMDKVVILMTDGENTLGTYDEYNGYGRQKEIGIERGDPGYNSLYDVDGEGVLNKSYGKTRYKDLDDNKTLQACSAMKQAGVIIYTVLLIDGNSEMMRDCATSPKHAFVANSAADLADDFATIGEELSSLRISK